MKSPLRIAVSAVRLLVAVLLTLASSPMWAQTNAVPFVNQPLVPTSTAPGGLDFTLTVNGTGFVSGSTVNWNGGALATAFVSSSQLTATVPAANIAKPATAVVTVASPSPGGGVSNPVYFQIASKTTSLSFVNSQILTIPAGALSVTVGDFNGDGKLDLAVGSTTGVSVFLGNGDGTFQPRVDYASVQGPEIIAADLCGNGTIDLAVVSYSGQISILLGNGDGTFQPHVDYSGYPLGLYPGSSIVSGDFNGDGKLDLAAAWSCQTTICGSVVGATSVFLGNGDGTFQPYINTSSVPNDQFIAAGDFNRDGNLDLAAAMLPCSSGNCEMLSELALGKGDGTFTLSFSAQDGGLSYTSAVVAADLNGDENLDSLVCNGTLSVLLGKGDGTFQIPIKDTGFGCVALAVGDFHGNGFLDVALVTFPRGMVYSGDGTGQFVLGPTLPSNGGLSGIAVGDFNGDGRLDVVLAKTDNTVWVDLQKDPGVAALSPTSLNFGTLLVGETSAAQPVTLTNTGGSPLSISNITVSSQFTKTDNCPVGGSLQTGASCTISVTFAPTTAGNAAGTLSVINNGLVSPANVALVGTAQDFAWGESSPLSQTVSPGQTANYSLFLSAKGGFNGGVEVTCSGAPAGATCSLTPSSVTVSPSSSGTVTVAIATKGGAAAGLVSPVEMRSVRDHLALWLAFSGLPGLVVLGGIGWLGKRKVRVRGGLALLCLLFFMITWSGCGGGGTRGSAATPAGTYPITMTATFTGSGGKLIHTLQLTLVVN